MLMIMMSQLVIYELVSVLWVIMSHDLMMLMVILMIMILVMILQVYG